MDIKEASEIQNSKKIVEFPDVTQQDLNPDRVLAYAYGKLSEVVIAGVDKDGNYFFTASNKDGSAILWLLEKLKIKLLTGLE